LLVGEQLAEHRHAAAAAGAGARAGLDAAHRGQLAGADGGADRGLGDVVARADLRVIVEGFQKMMVPGAPVNPVPWSGGAARASAAASAASAADGGKAP
jgi:hypothetical protein